MIDRARLESLLGSPVTGVAPLSGGCIAEVAQVTLADGRAVVVKAGGGGLARWILEGWMLDTLRARCPAVPVPRVLAAAEDLLILEAVDTTGTLDAPAQEHAAEIIAALHGVTAERHGLERDTVIGGLPQANPPTASWRAFFAEHRLCAMAREAHDAGRLPAALVGRIDTLAGRLDRWIDDDVPASLLHGDLWTGNVLVGRNGRISGLIDPAIYYGDAEMDLAFSTLFGTFGDPFFRRYGELRPLRPGFFEVRRDLYNLWPLLVHVRLFGGSYVGGVTRTLTALGC